MWTASLIERRENNQNIDFVVEFTNGTESFRKTYNQEKGNINVNDIKGRAASLLQDLNNPKELALGAIEIDVYTPTQAEKDAFSFAEDYRHLRGIQRAIELGLLTGDEKAVTDLRAKVKSNFKITYIDIL